MAENGSTPAGTRTRHRTETTYVLQVAFEVEVEPEIVSEPVEGEAPVDGQVTPAKFETAWYDAATVTVPAGTKRSTVRDLALKQAGILPPLGAEPVRTRLLDEESAEETPVESELQLRIGGGS